MRKFFCAILITTFFIQAAYSEIHYKNASQNKMAQELFDKGMLNYYGYLYVQAEYDFRQALLYDEQCGMCYWGIAVAKKQQALELGQPFAKLGFADIQKAVNLISPAHRFEHDLVKATMNSFSLNPKVKSQQLQLAYINSLRNLYKKYKNDVTWRTESLALLVDAIMYYSNVDDPLDNNHCSREVDKDLKKEAIGLLTPILKNPAYPDHPGLIHTYIHMTERNLTDPLGLMLARKLPTFSHAEIAHYTHMPNHIYWRRGMYKEAIRVNEEAIKIDINYFKHNGAGLNSYYYEYHYLHSNHFLVALGILTNNYKLAIDNARTVKNLMDVSRLEDLKDYRDTLLTLEHLVLARFEKWHEVLRLQTPAQTDQLGHLFINFTKALAYLHLGQNDAFKKISTQIKNEKYTRSNLLDMQTLVVSYLQASEMSLHKKPLAEIEDLFSNNKVKGIEDKLFVMNPPLWFFPYQLLLSDTAAAKGDVQAAKYHHGLYEKLYPHSTLGQIAKTSF